MSTKESFENCVRRRVWPSVNIEMVHDDYMVVNKKTANRIDSTFVRGMDLRNKLWNEPNIIISGTIRNDTSGAKPSISPMESTVHYNDEKSSTYSSSNETIAAGHDDGDNGDYVALSDVNQCDQQVDDVFEEDNEIPPALPPRTYARSSSLTFPTNPSRISERLSARAMTKDPTKRHSEPLLPLDYKYSDSESILSTDVNQAEYFAKLKEFELTVFSDKMNDRHKVSNPELQSESHQDLKGQKSMNDHEDIKTELQFNHIDKSKCESYDLTAQSVPGSPTSLENVIQDFLQYFHKQRQTSSTDDMQNNMELNQDQMYSSLMNQKTSSKPDVDSTTNNSENIAQTSPPPVTPSPPQRRTRSETSHDYNRQHYGQQCMPAKTYGGPPPPSTRLPDREVGSLRSPSIRKRDIMMRRYNSTSVLPRVTPVDMNRNHLMDSKDAYIIGTNGNDGNNATESDKTNGFERSQSEQRLVQVDIVGESFEARYPWQRDISTQCDLSGDRGSVSSGVSFSSGISSSSDWNSYTDANNQICRNYVDSNCTDKNDNASNRRQFVDSVRRRQNVIRTRRPHSMTCLDSSNIYNSNSDMYRSDSNLNYRHGRTSSESSLQSLPNRKRMPLLISDDPGSVSDLESIMENPHDDYIVENGRHNSIGNESTCTELSVDLKRLEEVRGSLTDTPNNDHFVLRSPTVSPEMWAEIPAVVVNTEKGLEEQEHGDKLLTMGWNANFLSVPRKPTRRLSSGSLNSGSDESDHEISPPVARRGRRAAIVDTKNFGDVSPTTLSPEVSPSNSCDEGETGSNIAGRLRRRRSSHDVSMNVYPGDLLVQEHHKKLIKRNTISDFYAARNGPTGPLGAGTDDNKKQRQPFSLLKLMKTRSKESLHLSDVLKNLKPSEFKDNHLAAYKNVHWTDLIACTDKQSSISDSLNISEMERKRRESVWELFKSECVFLIDHLMVLKHCFLEPLKKVQVEGFLMYTEPSEIFSNLDELCYVSYTFCKDFIASLLKDMSITDFGSTTVLIKAFQRFSNHSKDGSVYHTYCLNYTNALSYLEKLRKNDDFCEFEKWCEQDQRCNRLQLADLLIGPMQHCTKLPLLLHNIQKYTEDIVDKKQIVESIEKVEMSLRQLEEKMKWLKNFERVQDIQRHLVWPSITDLDSRAFIPEYLKPRLTRQPCERLLACPSRQLIHEGAVTLTESTKSFDAYLFLFDDILLITKTKKPNRKKQSSSEINNATGQPENQTYTVHRQPIALDRLGVHDVMPNEATANGLKCAFVIVQISRFQQIIDVFTLQAPNEAIKGLWISQILDVKSRVARSNSRGSSLKDGDDASPTSGSVRKGRHGKSLSIDAVFL